MMLAANRWIVSEEAIYMEDSKLFRNSQEKLLLEGSSSENLNQFAKLYHQQVSNLCFRT